MTALLHPPAGFHPTPAAAAAAVAAAAVDLGAAFYAVTNPPAAVADARMPEMLCL
jgi:hypothetical protein